VSFKKEQIKIRESTIYIIQSTPAKLVTEGTSKNCPDPAESVVKCINFDVVAAKEGKMSRCCGIPELTVIQNAEKIGHSSVFIILN